MELAAIACELFFIFHHDIMHIFRGKLCVVLVKVKLAAFDFSNGGKEPSSGELQGTVLLKKDHKMQIGTSCKPLGEVWLWSAHEDLFGTR
jgi:hypothetical protein